MMKWPLGWHLGAGDAPGRGDELRLLGGDCMSLVMPLSSLEVTILLHPAAAQLSPSPSPPGSPALVLGTGRRWQTGSCCPTLGPSITRCVLLHESKSSGCSRGSGRHWCLAQQHGTSLQPESSQYPPSAREKPRAEISAKT